MTLEVPERDRINGKVYVWLKEDQMKLGLKYKPSGINKRVSITLMSNMSSMLVL